MAPRRVNVLSGIEIDEISLVDRPANQHARVAIAKRAEEDAMPEYFTEEGQPVDLEDLEVGSVVYDGEGNGYELALADDDENEQNEYAYEDSDDEEREPVGKSFAEQIREDLSKALSDVERDDVISKAMGEVSKAEKRAQRAEEIAKSERQLRLQREYISKAADYNVAGVAPEELGPVLMRMAEALPYEDCAVIHKALVSAGEAFAELGYTGSAETENDPMAMVDAYIADDVSKAAGDGVSREALIAKAFAENPRAYDEYLATRRG